MKRLLLPLTLLLISIAGYAQQDAQFTQYMYNTIAINPAYAGSRGVLSMFGMYRTQWVGMDGAPTTSNLSFNTPFRDSKIGLGVSLLNDKIGPTNQTDFSADLSYTIRTSEKFKLSFGLKATVNIFNLEVSKLNPANQNDPQFQNLNNVFTPNVGAGVYLHSDKLYLGLSAPKFIESKNYQDYQSSSISVYEQKATYYFIGGYVFDLSDNIKFKPSVLYKMTMGSPFETDFSANFMFNQKFTLGASYRWNGTVSALAGFNIDEKLFIGYAYDYETNNLSNYNSGSHEIFLRFELFNSYKRVTSPRFF